MSLFSSNKKKYVAVFCSKEQDSYSVLEKKRIKADTQEVKHKKKKYIVDTSKYSFVDGITQYYYIDSSKATGQMLFGNHKKPVIDARIVSDVLDRQVLQDLSSDLTGKQLKINIFLGIFCGIFGGLIGYIVGMI